MPTSSDIPMQHRFHDLGPSFYREVPATPLPNPYLVAFNHDLASELNIALPSGDELPHWLVGNQMPASARPIASVYAGHQFGVYVPQLGDGRALLLGEVQTRNGDWLEMQLKGAGPTPYSRMGDGRAVLRSTIREYLASEAMHGLGIPTSRALAIGGSNAPVWREQLETAAVLTRLAPSHIRFGHFELFFYRGQHAQIQTLADFVIDHFYPACREQDNPYQALLEAVIARTSDLLVQWQAVGFCHGVMNTDNMSILGLTLDYGPYGFLDGFDPGHICNHSDETGRYAYSQQPQIALWNCSCLAQALIPLLDRDAAVAALQAFQPRFEADYLAMLRRKLGLATEEDTDAALLEELLELLAQARSDWTRFWRSLAMFTPGGDLTRWRDQVLDRERFDAWAERYSQRLLREESQHAARSIRMNQVNPKYVLRNHLAESAIRHAQAGDFSEVERLHQLLKAPFDEQPAWEAYADLPPDWAATLSVSCSS
ncbi:protein adenylyltransferase SelO [Parachitinimonas caeni]|uniref:Protein nucleotidyltransferase YdiU n=1 Tax=Parachitinimonas caeni TaxID=3031301 RepID=A0ABT7DW70_9NEIS|nr:YdiU family protein [Parachitinimonas caeni]MDK2123353.1 YdiU family protein [Parachitinimonas caeni]